MISSPLRLAAAAAVLVGGGCWAGSGGEQAERRQDGPATVLVVGTPVELAETGALNPTVAVDGKSGVVFAAWASDVPPPEDDLEDGEVPLRLFEVVVAASHDGGSTFGEPVVVSPPKTPVRSMAASPTQVAVGPGGEVYVLYLESTPRDSGGFPFGLSTMWLSRSEDGGTSFSEPVAVTDEAGEGVVTSTEMATLFVARDGDLFVSFLDYRDAIRAPRAGRPSRPETQLRITRSADGGRSWSPSVLVAPQAGECSGTQAAQGTAENPLLVTTRSGWLESEGGSEPIRDPIVAVSTDDGGTFAPPRKISDDGFKTGGCPDVTAGLAADGRGRVHAAWYTGAAPAPGVYHATSDDHGESWSTPRPLLTDDWVPAGDVRLVVDDRGAAWVALEDRRDDEEDRVRVVRVAPGGSVDASPPWAGRAPYLTAAGDGVIVAWNKRAHGDLVGSVNVAPVGVA